MSRYCIGIDLGTTNSTLAFLPSGDKSAPTTQPIAQLVNAGEIAERTLLPSFLYLPAEVEFQKGALALPWRTEAHDIVGILARTQGASTPVRLVLSAKSWLSHSGVDRRANILPWQAPDDIAKVSPLEATRRYLEHMREAWDQAHPDAPFAEQDVVLTVPASFDAAARDLTVEAAQAAGFGATLHLLEEPQAALYAWLADFSHDWRKELSVGDVILVVDIGGGTTDFSLISVSEQDGKLQLERIAVGEHILLGGDNMDLALAYAVAARLAQEGTKIDDWQMRALTHSCRTAKEAMLSDTTLAQHPLVIPGRSSRLIGGSIRSQLDRSELEKLLLDGFIPVTEKGSRPQAARRAGLTSLGLPYASDAAITRHLSAFLANASQNAGRDVHPTAILFNGGVTRSSVVRGRIQTVVDSWVSTPVKVLSGADPDLAVSRGAAYYANARHGGGVRIRSGTAQAYYIGVERSGLAVPGMLPAVDALCIAPFGMEEGAEAELPEAFGLVVGEDVSFRVFGSATRQSDHVGSVVSPDELSELSPIETTLDGEAGRIVEVRLHARITEVGTLELSAVEKTGGKRWKLSFNVRVQ